MATDPESKALKAFPTLPPELEAISGQMLSWRKEKQSTATQPAGQIFDIVQSAKQAVPAQNCTSTARLPIRAAPQPARNAACPCGSGIKYKRCCIGKAAA
jgi:uncharacterized protein YecA (UPF0149 family)